MKSRLWSNPIIIVFGFFFFHLTQNGIVTMQEGLAITIWWSVHRTNQTMFAIMQGYV